MLCVLLSLSTSFLYAVCHFICCWCFFLFLIRICILFRFGHFFWKEFTLKTKQKWIHSGNFLLKSFQIVQYNRIVLRENEMAWKCIFQFNSIQFNWNKPKDREKCGSFRSIRTSRHRVYKIIMELTNNKTIFHVLWFESTSFFLLLDLYCSAIFFIETEEKIV